MLLNLQCQKEHSEKNHKPKKAKKKIINIGDCLQIT